MRIEQLYYFAEVVKEKTISGAAEKIFVSQQAISQAVNLLEEEVGEKLLIRTHKGIALTEAGEIFYRKTATILQEFGELKTSLLSDKVEKTQESTELNIYTSVALSQMILENIICDFYNQYPNLKITLSEKSYLEIFPLLVRETDKIAFASTLTEYFSEYVSQQYKDELVWEVFYRDELLVAVSKKSPFAKKNSISLQEVLEQPLTFENMYDDCSSLQVLAKSARQDGRVSLNTNSAAVRKKAVEENMAITLVTRVSVETGKNEIISDKMIFLPLTKKLHVTYLYLKSQKHQNSHIEDILIQAVRDYFNDKY